MTSRMDVPTPSGWDAIEPDDEYVAMVNGDADGLDGVFLAMVYARRIGDDREAKRLATAYREWLRRAGKTPEGYSRAEASAEVSAILGPDA